MQRSTVKSREARRHEAQVFMTWAIICRGSAGQNPGEKSRFLEKGEIALWTPESRLARHESFLPDIAATVL
jgi:hypothetical protein